MRTILEVRKDLQSLVDLGMTTLYWYLSLCLMIVSIDYYNPQGFTSDIVLSFTIGVTLIYIYYLFAFVWLSSFIKDYNGVPYFINIFTKCYFKGTYFDKYNEKMYQ